MKETYKDKDGQTHSDSLPGFVNWQIEDPELIAAYDEQPYVRFVAGTKEGTTRVTGEYFGHTIAFDVTVTKNPIKPKIMTLVADPTYYVFDDADDQPVVPVIKAIYSDATVQTLKMRSLNGSAPTRRSPILRKTAKSRGRIIKAERTSWVSKRSSGQSTGHRDLFG